MQQSSDWAGGAAPSSASWRRATSSGRCSASIPRRSARGGAGCGARDVGPLRGCARARRRRRRHPVHRRTSITPPRSLRRPRPASTCSARSRSAPPRSEMEAVAKAGQRRQAFSSASAMSDASSRGHRARRPPDRRRARHATADGRQLQPGQVPRPAGRQLAPVGRGGSRRPAVGHRHPSRRPVDCAAGQPTEVWARLATRGSPFANGDTLGVMIAFELRRHRPPDRDPGNAVHRPHRGVRLARLDGDPRPHASRASVRLGRHRSPVAADRRRRTSCRRIPRCATTSRLSPAPSPAARPIRSASRRLPPTCAPSRPSRAPRRPARSSAFRVIPASAQRVSGNPAKSLHRYALRLDTRSALRLAGMTRKRPDLTKSSLRVERELC